MYYLIYNTKTLEVRGVANSINDLDGDFAINNSHLAIIETNIAPSKAKVVYDNENESYEVQEISLPLNWLGLEQALYQSALLQKGLLSQGNGFAFLCKVLSDGKTTGASENALLLAINATLQGLQGQNTLTTQEITDLNELLLQYNFTIQIS